MKKVYRIEGIDCADCAAKLERSVAKLDGVKKAGINFITQKLTVEAEEEDIFDNVLKFIAKNEPDAEISEI